MTLSRGIVSYCDGQYGEIQHKNEKYIFLKKDMMNEICKGDIVSFKAEEVKGYKRAYFVNSLEKKDYKDMDKKYQK